MKLQALKASYGDYGSVKRGEIVDVREDQAKKLLGTSLFKKAGDAARPLSDKAAAKPGQTGKGKRQSSSAAGQASKKKQASSKASKQEAKADPASGQLI